MGEHVDDKWLSMSATGKFQRTISYHEGMVARCPVCDKRCEGDLIAHMFFKHRIEVWVKDNMGIMYGCMCGAFRTSLPSELYEHLTEHGKDCAIAYLLAGGRCLGEQGEVIE
jgi:hypothetical protein